LKRDEANNEFSPYAPLPEQESILKFIDRPEEEDNFKEIKEVNVTEEETKGPSDQFSGLFSP